MLLGTAPRTLSFWTHSAGVRGFRVVRMWCRLVVAAGLLRQEGWSTETVAFRLGFCSGEDLRKATRRHAGISLNKLARSGEAADWFALVLAHARGEAASTNRGIDLGKAPGGDLDRHSSDSSVAAEAL